MTKNSSFFWYQLTEWVDNIEELRSHKDSLEQYHQVYLTKKNEDGQFALFTMGDYIDEDYKFQLRQEGD